MMMRAFTLVEALAALAILSVALAVLLAGQSRAARAGARARETAAVRRAVERISAEALAGVLTDDAPIRCGGCIVEPIENVLPLSGTNAAALRAWQITSSNEPSVGIRLFLAGETTRQILMR